METLFKSFALKFIFGLVLIQLVFASCEYIGLENELDTFVTYTILEGSHYSNEKYPEVFSASQLRFSVMFDSTAIYKTVDPNNQEGINKLYGFADCDNVDHHVNSARVGWRYYQNRLQLLAYTYNNGERSEAFIKNIEIGKEYTCTIDLDSNNYVFTMDNDPVYISMQRGCTSTEVELSKLFPFFGGEEPAPHEILIKIKDLKSIDNEVVSDAIDSGIKNQL
jgi:hypothetical protein